MIVLYDHLMSVTPEMAGQFLQHDIFDGQRSVRRWHATLLSDLMRAGKFRRGSTVYFCEFENRLYCVDGQHTLTAITLSGVTQPLLVIKIPVSKKEEIGRIYASFGRELGRTPADVFAALGIAHQLKLSTPVQNAAHGAMRIVLSDFRVVSVFNNLRAARDAEFIADTLSDASQPWRAALTLYVGALELAPKYLVGSLRDRSVMSVALGTIGGAISGDIQARAVKFWETVAMNDGLRRGDPAKALVDWLAANNAGSAAGRCAAVASAWNAWFENRQLENLRQTSKGQIGLTLRGTRFRAMPPGEYRAARRGGVSAGADDHESLPLAAMEAE